MVQRTVPATVTAACLAALISAACGCSPEPPALATNRSGVAHRKPSARPARPATEPTLPQLIDAATVHADDTFDELRLAGLAAVVSADDQRYLDQQVDQWQKKLDDHYAELKATHKPANHYSVQWVLDASDAAPSGVAGKLAHDRPSLAPAMSVGAARVYLTVPVLVIHPDQFDHWLTAAGTSAADAKSVEAVAAVEVAKVTAAGDALADAGDPDGAMSAYVRRKGAARRAVWEAIARILPADRRRALGEAMLSPDSRSADASAVALLEYRDKRLWAPADVPPAALADSDQATFAQAPAAGRYSLLRADDGHVVCTVQLDKGDDLGFAMGGVFGLSMSAVDRQQLIDVDPGRYVYYWVRAAADVPLVDPPVPPVSPSPLQPTTRPAAAVAPAQPALSPAAAADLARRIDVATWVAHDDIAQLAEAGVAYGLNDADQKWLDQQVADGQRELDAVQAQDRANSVGPSDRTPEEIRRRGDGLAGGDANVIALGRPAKPEAIRKAVTVGLGCVRALVPTVIVYPGDLHRCLMAAGVSAEAAGRVEATAADQAAKVAAAATRPLAAYERAKIDARRAILAALASSLSPGQRRAFADAMTDPTLSGASALGLGGRAEALLRLRERRRWAAFVVPPGAVVNSDAPVGYPAPAAGRYSLYRCDDPVPLATLDVPQGQQVGFEVDTADVWVAAVAGPRVASVRADEHVYYWVRAASDARLVPIPLPFDAQPTVSPTGP